MHLSALHIYPVKSCSGLAVASAAIDDLGLAGDRRFLVVDEAGRFLTQRTFPRMALIETALTADTLTLSAAGGGAVDVPRAADPEAPLRTVSIWKSEGLLAEDCGDAPAAWLARWLGAPCRLVRIGEKFRRPVLKKAARPDDVFAFADGSPVLVISEASLDELNGRLAAQGEPPLPMNRFRPNVVIAGCDAFAEDQWKRLRIGDVRLLAAGKSDRCIITTTDQATAQRGKEPLRTLATYRRDPVDSTSVYFGANFIQDTKRGTLHVGAAVEAE